MRYLGARTVADLNMLISSGAHQTPFHSPTHFPPESSPLSSHNEPFKCL